MTSQKRPLEDASSSRKSKKTKIAGKPKKKEAKVEKPAPVAEDVDFPRGGGTSFTPLEVKTIRAEAVKEADEALFKVRNQIEFSGSELENLS
jgi:rRNA biogenesis protein RRP5